jgi:beta-glucosidase/6-phospho-beta-glucosidase/beta-galactosidase
MINSYICLGTGYPEKRDDTVPVETALDDNARIQHILSHLFAVSEAIKYVQTSKCYLQTITF